ncbi:MAG: hypothetical protein ACLUTO_07410 [Anaerostipes sp.]
MKQKKTLQILLLVFAGLFVLYTGISFYQKNKSSKEDSDQNTDHKFKEFNFHFL